MGKNKKKDNFTTLSNLMEERKRVEKELEKITIKCSHTNDSGRLKVDFLNKGNLVKCKKCGCVFDYSILSPDELHEGVRRIHNAVNQIKSMTDDPSIESGVIKTLGELDYNLKEAEELYNKIVNNNAKNKNKNKKNKKNKNRDEFGSYGANSISFISSGRMN